MLTDDAAKKNIATHLSRLMAERGMSLRKVAAETGESHTMIGNYVRGEMMPGAGPLARLAELFKVSTDLLLSDPHKKGRKKTA